MTVDEIPATAASAAMSAASDMQAADLDDDAPGRSVVRVMIAAALPHLVTDETVERAAEAIAYELVDSDATYWRHTARRALEAALGSTA
ncbi:MAG: hypothetical protein M3Q39_13930 [Actinomycetota bacterium]|nr:hypothetical protein [Actinomycetota bacterium]